MSRRISRDRFGIIDITLKNMSKSRLDIVRGHLAHTPIQVMLLPVSEPPSEPPSETPYMYLRLLVDPQDSIDIYTFYYG